MNILTIDIGNTNTVTGFFQDGELIMKLRMSTSVERTHQEYSLFFSHYLQEKNISKKDIHAAAVSSVVPELDFRFTRILREDFLLEPQFISSKSRLNFTITYDNPSEIGADRIVNAAAAWEMYKKAVIVVDFGTATTVEFLSDQGEYQGGLILPGINLMRKSLHSHTAKLPEVALTRPEKILGKNTVKAIQTGLYYNLTGGLRHIITSIRKETNSEAPVLATGGLATLLKNDLPELDRIDPDLTLKGLEFLFRLNHEK